MQKSVAFLLNSAIESLAIDISGPGLPVLAAWAARMLVRRCASDAHHSSISLSNLAGDR